MIIFVVGGVRCMLAYFVLEEHTNLAHSRYFGRVLQH